MSILDYLRDYRVVKIGLPVADGAVSPLDAVAKVTTSPRLEVIFLKGQLESLAVRMGEGCRITFDVAGVIHTIQATILEQSAPSRLLLQMVEGLSHEQKRDYFRVDACLTVRWWRIDDEEDAPVVTSVQGIVNVSGGGIRLPVTEPIPVGSRVGLAIELEPDSSVIECVAEVVGVYQFSREAAAAMKFVEIQPLDRDAVIAFCLAEQRRQLRVKVQVVDFL